MSNFTNITTHEGISHQTKRVPVLGIVCPLLTVIPIFIGLGVSFWRYHKRRKALVYRKGIMSPQDRPRIKAPSAAMKWEVEFTDLLKYVRNKKENNEHDEEKKPDTKNTVAKKYETTDSPIKTITESKDNKAEVRVAHGKYWATPRRKSADFELMPVISKHNIKYNTKQDDDRTKRKLIDNAV
ncbi:unnamed protein product [Mytilus coruscus]|uniref:Uncharacterized protein n=1 Tax=Mytilus coruscus TaxID=42192 RepID=A0A6J8E7E2_MYTCO|nr:unnamed protein product [Mytilus coruscus]